MKSSSYYFVITIASFFIEDADQAFGSHSLNQKNSIKVLSLKANKMNGFIAAKILEAIEERNKKRIYKQFDLIVADSMGALVALAIGNKYSASDIVDFYNKSGDIFYKKNSGNKIKYCIGGKKYSTKHFDKTLDDLFSGATLADTCIPVSITAVDDQSERVHLFSSAKVNKGIQKNQSLKDVIKASASCDKTLRLSKLQKKNGQSVTFSNSVDHHIDPTIHAFEEAKYLFPEAKSIMIVSLDASEDTTKTRFNRTQSHKALKAILAQGDGNNSFYCISAKMVQQGKINKMNHRSLDYLQYSWEETLNSNHKKINEISDAIGSSANKKFPIIKHFSIEKIGQEENFWDNY